MYRISPQEREQFDTQGFILREKVFSEDTLEELRQAAEDVHEQVLAASKREDAPPTDRIDQQRFQSLCGSTIKWEWSRGLHAVRSMEPAHHLHARFDALVDDPRLWGPCRDLVGSEELSLFSDKLNIKRPGGAPFPWHQEGPYWAHGAEQVESIVSVLIYLDEGRPENGCLWAIPGSHRYGTLPGLKDRGVLGALYTDIEQLEGEPLAVATGAGSVLWFHRDLVHGSQSNRSDTDRRVFVLAYQPAGLRRWRIDDQRPIQGNLSA